MTTLREVISEKLRMIYDYVDDDIYDPCVNAILSEIQKRLPKELNRKDVYVNNSAAEWRDIGYNQCLTDVKQRLGVK